MIQLKFYIIGASILLVTFKPVFATENCRSILDVAKKNQEVSFDDAMIAFKPLEKYSSISDTRVLGGSVEELWDRIPPRNVRQDIVAADLVTEMLPAYKALGAFVIVDSGHAHSIAIAVRLAERGYEPVLKMQQQTSPIGFIQPVGAMKFYANRMRLARAKLDTSSPIALIMDLHREDDKIKYDLSSFPTVQTLKRRYNGKIIWITEGPKSEFTKLTKRRDVYNYALPDFLKSYFDKGIEIYQHVANPYHFGYGNTGSIKLRKSK